MEENKTENLKKEILAQVNHEIAEHLFTKKEVEDLKQLLEQDRRAKWFWASLRTWILAISSVIALFTVGFEGLKVIIKRFLT